jgi:hypothetical protein
MVLLAPGFSTPVSNAPMFAVAVWPSPPVLRQVTLSLAFTVTLAGAKSKSWIVTVWLAPGATDGAATAQGHNEREGQKQARDARVHKSDSREWSFAISPRRLVILRVNAPSGDRLIIVQRPRQATEPSDGQRPL